MEFTVCRSGFRGGNITISITSIPKLREWICLGGFSFACVMFQHYNCTVADFQHNCRQMVKMKTYCSVWCEI